MKLEPAPVTSAAEAETDIAAMKAAVRQSERNF
jgi:hypothetical protein